MIQIIPYQDEYAPRLRQIFYDSVRQVCIKDYSHEQIVAWAPSADLSDDARAKYLEMSPFVAELDGKLVGYASLDDKGYIDHFFCAPECQGQGCGGLLIQSLIEKARLQGIRELTSNVSITAKPFFEHMGFEVVKPQQVELKGIGFINYQMVYRFTHSKNELDNLHTL